MPFDSEVTATVAYAEVTGGNPPTFLLNRGFASITRNGAGDYTLALETNEGLADANKQTFLTVKGTVPLIVAVEDVDATNIRVRAVTHDNMASEVSFSVEVKRPTNNFN